MKQQTSNYIIYQICPECLNDICIEYTDTGERTYCPYCETDNVNPLQLIDGEYEVLDEQ